MAATLVFTIHNAKDEGTWGFPYHNRRKLADALRDVAKKLYGAETTALVSFVEDAPCSEKKTDVPESPVAIIVDLISSKSDSPRALAFGSAAKSAMPHRKFVVMINRHDALDETWCSQD
jgi:hypothetical protein